MKLLEKLSSRNWQKICQADDYNKPEFKYVLEEVFKQPPTYHRKQWEFVVIYLNLLKYGKLNEDSKGVSFGAGRERIIFDISKQVKNLTATDLYVYNTAWATAKVEKGMSCYDFVLEKAPINFDDQGLEVLEMDMRSLSFKDNSMDFCYSSCAFEHIGGFKDFVSHLKEAKRVLKEGGVYVMTTEHLFNHETIAIEGNYKFDFEYLKNVFQAADFFPEPEFNAIYEKGFLNKPKPDLLPLSGFSPQMMNFLPSLIISQYGIPYTSSCFVFKKDSHSQSRDVAINQNTFSNSNFLMKLIRNNVKLTYSDYKSIDPTLSLKKETRIALADHMDYLVDDFENYLQLSELSNKHFAYTDFIYFDDFECRFAVDLGFESETKIKAELIERPQDKLNQRKSIQKINKTMSGNNVLHFDFKANKNKVYAIAIHHDQPEKLKLLKLDIKAKIRN